jgi:hypothetical protein
VKRCWSLFEALGVNGSVSHIEASILSETLILMYIITFQYFQRKKRRTARIEVLYQLEIDPLCGVVYTQMISSSQLNVLGLCVKGKIYNDGACKTPPNSNMGMHIPRTIRAHQAHKSSDFLDASQRQPGQCDEGYHNTPGESPDPHILITTDLSPVEL